MEEGRGNIDGRRNNRGAGHFNPIDITELEKVTLDPGEAEFYANLGARNNSRPKSVHPSRNAVRIKKEVIGGSDDSWRRSMPRSSTTTTNPSSQNTRMVELSAPVLPIIRDTIRPKPRESRTLFGKSDPRMPPPSQAPIIPLRMEEMEKSEEKITEDITTISVTGIRAKVRGKLRRGKRVERELRLPKQYDQLLDMAVKEDFTAIRDSLKSCIYKAGTDNFDRDIIVIVASAVNPKIMNLKLLLLYLVCVMDPVVERDYTLVYCHSNMSRHNLPSFTFLRQVYGIFNRKYKKNLKALYIIHPTFWIKGIAKLFKPFISSKFWTKLVYISNVTDVYNYMKPNQLKLPDHVLAHKRKGGTLARPIFGVPLEEALEVCPTESGIPVVCESAFEYLEEKSLHIEGLFRIPGSNVLISDLKKAFDRGESVDLMKCDEPHVIAGLLKQYLRELPEPLFTFELYSAFTQCQRALEKYDKMKPALMMLLGKLSEPARLLLRHLFALLNQVVQNQEINKMGAANCAIVFGPNLMRSRGDSMRTVITDAGCINSIMKILIEHYDELLPLEVEEVKEE